MSQYRDSFMLVEEEREEEWRRMRKDRCGDLRWREVKRIVSK